MSDNMLKSGMVEAHEAATICGVTYQTMYNWRRKGKGPCYYKLSGRYFYKVEDLKDWIEGGLVDPSTTNGR